MPRCPRCSSEVPTTQRFCGGCGAPVDGTATIASPTPSSRTPEEGRFPPGTVLAQRYRISGKLGQGGMGEVYRATDLLLGQTVALKFLTAHHAAGESTLDRFRNEVRLARQVSHPNVCRVYDIGEAQGSPFLTMEYVDGEDLASLLRRIGHLPADKGTEAARRLCAGLAAAHEKGVLHRDLKPANVMIDGRGQVRITDFGLAGLAGDIRHAEVRAGTPAYMSPEHLAGREVTEKSDIYALGLVLYEVFTGKRPFDAPSLAELQRKQQAGPPSLTTLAKDVDPAVERVIVRCLDPDPAKRPASALSVAAALPGGDPLAAALAAGETPSPDLVAAAGSKEAMKPWLAVACFAALVLGFAMMAWLAGRALSGIPSELGPEALAQQARTILAGLGYPKPAAQAWDFDYDAARLEALRHMDAAKARAQIAEARPPIIYLWYRTSPMRMTPWTSWPRVRELDPPQRMYGTTTLRLDTEGRLCRLSAIPPRLDPGPAAGGNFDWKPLFTAAGLDMARFTPATPSEMPPRAFDASAAWVDGSGPGALRVEAAAWRGRAVWFSLSRGEEAGTSPERAVSIAFLAVRLLALLIAVVWGRRNLRQGRADVRGGARLAALVFATDALWRVLAARHGLDAAELQGLFLGLALSLFQGVFIGAMYLALEPYVRRRWPHALIGWTRAWSGALRDPLVGREVLAGMAAGAWLAVLWILVAKRGGGAFQSKLSDAVSTAVVASFLARYIAVAIMNGGVLLMGVAALSRVLRNRWLSAVAMALLLASVFLPLGWRSWAAYFLAILGVLTLQLRLGLLAAVAALWIEFLVNLPLTLNTSAWFFYATPLAFAVVLALGTWAFLTALAGQKLLAEE